MERELVISRQVIFSKKLLINLAHEEKFTIYDSFEHWSQSKTSKMVYRIIE